MPNPSQEPSAFSRAPNLDLKDIDVLCTLKIKIKTQNLKHGVQMTSDHIQIKVKMPNPSQHSPASSKAPNLDLKDIDVLCSFEIKVESGNSEHWCFKAHWPYLNQDQDSKPHSGTSSLLQSPKGQLKGHECSLHHQNQDRKPKFGSLVYQRPNTLSKSRSRSQVKNLQCPPKP